jgi:hypothetical protein
VQCKRRVNKVMRKKLLYDLKAESRNTLKPNEFVN